MELIHGICSQHLLWWPGVAGAECQAVQARACIPSSSPGGLCSAAACGWAWGLLPWNTPSCQPARWPGTAQATVFLPLKRKDDLGLGREKGMFEYKRDLFEWKLIHFVPNSLNSSHIILWPRPPFSRHLTCSVRGSESSVFLLFLSHHVFTDDLILSLRGQTYLV